MNISSHRLLTILIVGVTIVGAFGALSGTAAAADGHNFPSYSAPSGSNTDILVTSSPSTGPTTYDGTDFSASNQYGTISAAIGGASADDTIVVVEDTTEDVGSSGVDITKSLTIAADNKGDYTLQTSTALSDGEYAVEISADDVTLTGIDVTANDVSSGNDADGIHLGSGADNVQISHATITGVDGNPGSITSDSDLNSAIVIDDANSNANIQYNTFSKDFLDSGIEITDANNPVKNVDIDNNDFSGVGTADSTNDLNAIVNVFNATDAVNITSNTFNNHEVSQGVVHLQDKTNALAADITVAENVFKDYDIGSTVPGVDTTAANGNGFDGQINVSNNTFDYADISGTDGIQIDADGGDVSDVVIEENTFTGLGDSASATTAVTFDGGSSATITQANLHNNSVSLAGSTADHVFHVVGSSFTLDNLNVSANPADPAKIGGNTVNALKIASASVTVNDVVLDNVYFDNVGYGADIDTVGNSFGATGVNISNTNNNAIDVDGSPSSSVNVNNSVFYNVDTSSIAVDLSYSLNSENEANVNNVTIDRTGSGINLAGSGTRTTLTVQDVAINDTENNRAIEIDDANANDVTIQDVSATNLSYGSDVNGLVIDDLSGRSDTTFAFDNVTVEGIKTNAGSHAGHAIKFEDPAASLDLTLSNFDVRYMGTGVELNGNTFDNQRANTLDINSFSMTNVSKKGVFVDTTGTIDDNTDVRTIKVSDGSISTVSGGTGVDVDDISSDINAVLNLTNITVDAVENDGTGVALTSTTATVDTLTLDDVDVSNANDGIDIGNFLTTSDVSITDTDVTGVSNNYGIRVGNSDLDIGSSDSGTISISAEDQSTLNFSQSSTTGIVVAGTLAADDLDISDVDANNTDTGISVSGQPSTNVNIDQVEFTNSTTAGVDATSTSSQQINVTDSYFADNTEGIILDFTGSPFADVTNNDFEDNSQAAVNLENGPSLSHLNLSYNWWNSETGPTVGSSSSPNFAGNGENITDEAGVISRSTITNGNLNFVPFLDAADGQPVSFFEGDLKQPDGNTGQIEGKDADFNITSVGGSGSQQFTYSEIETGGLYVGVVDSGGVYDAVANVDGFAASDTTAVGDLRGSDTFASFGNTIDLQTSATVNATVTAPSGDALANTQVQIVDAADDSQLATATTDSNGVAAFGVTPLTGDSVYVNDTAGNLPDSSEATLTVDSGEQVNQSFTLGGQLNGTVFYPNSTVANNTDITFTENSGADDVVSTTTDENGTYTVNITARDGDGTQDYTLQAANGSFDPSDSQTVTITEGEETSQNFTLKSLETASLTATIENGTSEEALTNTDVTLTASSSAPGSLDTTRQTDSNGEITLRIPASSPQTSYDITANADGFESRTVGFAPDTGEDVKATFSLSEATGPTADFTIDLVNGPSTIFQSQSYSATVNVTNEGGASGTQDITYALENDTTQNTPITASNDSVELGAGESTDITFSVPADDTAALENGSYTHVFSSDDDELNEPVTVTVEGAATTKTGFYTNEEGEIAITQAVVDFRNSEGAFAPDSETTGSITSVVVAFRQNQE